ncbi:MAG: hypothetical protein P0Y53_22255 [Candidatus Pseudobacter hemicellulosilyticus]|uniref:MORN repeat protein n=1 Tax=Candidatus Pseudobacter hemicellulosilyticus TaxID=3121375 RepID=A0AAJ5WT78_9BACT|nr:MAG: hypothetical protein P0Y53_22255 [Pseudobacter sp.]
MRCFLFLLLFVYSGAGAQSLWKEYSLNARGDTMNRIDRWDRKQGPWLIHYDNLRGEPGFEEEGWYKNNKKTGEWKLYSLMGDHIGTEYYKWDMKDSICSYYTIHGQLRLEQSWKAFNPDKAYDTLEIEDPEKFDTYRTVIVKNEGAAVRHGVWKYYDAESGALIRTETYTLGKLEGEKKTVAAPTEKKAIPKTKEMQEFEKMKGKKKVRYQDGSTGGGH